MRLWLNDSIMGADQARIDPMDRGFTLGDGLYETIRARDGQILRLARHLQRLRSGAAGLGIPLEQRDEWFAWAMTSLLKANNLGDGTLRLTLTRGPAPRGLATPIQTRPTLVITLATAGPAPPPAKAIIASVTRRNEHSPLARFKTLNMLDNILAKREAEQSGADDALLLNSQGKLAESTIANLFVVIGGKLVTPPLANGALPGVMRAEIIEHQEVEERSLTPADLEQATEAFLTNANHVRALVSVAGRPIGDGDVGPMTKRVMDDV